MKVFIIWLAGFIIAAAVFVFNLKDSDFKEASGWGAVIGAACLLAVWSWVAVAIILLQVFLRRFGGE